MPIPFRSCHQHGGAQVIAFLVFLVCRISIFLCLCTKDRNCSGSATSNEREPRTATALRFFDPMTAPIPVRPFTRFPLETMAAEQAPCSLRPDRWLRLGWKHLSGRLRMADVVSTMVFPASSGHSTNSAPSLVIKKIQQGVGASGDDDLVEAGELHVGGELSTGRRITQDPG